MPLAQLPTSTRKPETTQPAASPSAAVTAEPSASVAVPEPMKIASEPQPIAPAERAVDEPAKPKTNTIVSTAPAGSAQERNILTWNTSEYTIQLLGVSSQKAALDFIAAQPNKSDLLMFKSKRQGRDWFVVITGRFASSAQARQGIARLPASQRDAGPWSRDVKTIQSEIKAAM